MTRPSLVWAIRDSFLEYLAVVEDTRIETSRVERGPEGFVFPPADDPLAFRGRLRITAHAGALDVTLEDPRLEDDGDGAVLTGDLGAGRAVIARLLDVPEAAGLADGGSADDVALTMDGATWLGGVYAPWARMAPVRIRPL